MKNQIHFSSRSEARRGNARSIISYRSGAWRGLLLAGCCAVLTGLAWPTRAGVSEAWVQRYSNVVTNANDQAFKVVSDAAGDIIVAGSTEDGNAWPDMLTIKYSGTNGSVLWQKRYNGPANGDDQLSAMAVDGSGNVVVTGSSMGSGGNFDFYTAKYAAADGALLWEKRYNGPANSDDQAIAVAVDGSGNVVVTGVSGWGDLRWGTEFDFYTAKYAAADGALLWGIRYNGPANLDDVASAVAVDGSGNVVVTGYSVGSEGRYDFYTAKYGTSDGALLWERRYNGPANLFRDYAQGLALDANGNVVVTGNFYTAKYAAADGVLLWEKRDNEARAVAVDGSGNVVVTGGGFYTAKYAAADGALLWEQHYNGLANDDRNEGRAVAVDGSGNVVVTGVSGWAGSIAMGRSKFDFYTAKYAAADGALLWEKRYDGAENYDLYLPPMAVIVDDSGNVVLTGTSYNGTNYDYYTAKYAAADGALLWEKRYNGPANIDDQAEAVAVDGSGNVVVTGTSSNGDDTGNYYTAKYAAANGALLWEKRYNGGGQALAVDGSGNVVVTGSSAAGGSPGRETVYAYYTAKYAAADGALLWEKRGPGGGANALAVDGSGNVVVMGSWPRDYYTAKYAAADGALLWEKHYGPANIGDYTSGVAVDSSGNVVVTEGFQLDFYTAKYAAADGALLWEKRYNGPANGVDYPNAMAVDRSGNVVVTGNSMGSGGNADYYTAKYAAADGALLWEKRYNGGGQLAVDGSGNVVVTGSSASGGSPGSGFIYDYYTAKYAAADGALLWEKRGPGGGANALAVDGSGNVVVTGSSNNGTNSDYYTAKYAAADGALLWEKRYNGPANGNDRVATLHPLALGPNGMVVVTGSSDGDYATVVYRETLPPVAIELVPTGVRLRFTGVPGSSYIIERAPAVTGPWTTLNTQIAPASGLIEYLDTNPPVGSAFFRTRAP